MDKEEKIDILMDDIEKNEVLMYEVDWKIDSYKFYILKG